MLRNTYSLESISRLNLHPILVEVGVGVIGVTEIAECLEEVLKMEIGKVDQLIAGEVEARSPAS